MISIYHKGYIYNINQEPFENLEDTYKRGWFIINNYDKYDYIELYSLSIINNNKNIGMIY